MLKKTCGIGAVLAVGLALTLAGPAQAAPRNSPETPTEATIYVPDDFVTGLSDTRETGHYEVVGTGLHIWTESNTKTDKVAEYVAAGIPLADVGEPSLEYENLGIGTIAPGFQLVVDLNDDGQADGILVGESAYHGDWWFSGDPGQLQDGAPSNVGGSGSYYHGTLDQWRAMYGHAVVQAFGFSLGSGVQGDWNLNAIDFAGTHYTFAASHHLNSKNECKTGGWATSTLPLFKNQGDCVSYFAAARS